MPEDVLIPGARDVRGSLDTADAPECVVACPPHPEYGGSRRDGRLRAVGSALAGREIACLRFDYGGWDGGEDEQQDVANAVRWATERYEGVGLFGYSFGGTMAILAAPSLSITGLSLLAPASSLTGLDADPARVLDAVDGPLQVIFGSRDSTVDSTPIAARIRDRGGTVLELSADHFFIGQEQTVADHVAEFFADSSGTEPLEAGT